MTATADQQLFSVAAGCEEDRHAHRSGATFDCGADSIVEDLLIDVEDGRIVIVARRPTAFIGSPETEMLDLGDVTLLPGLIDIHQHLAFDASDDPVAHLFDVNDATLLLRAATVCSRQFLCGTPRPGGLVHPLQAIFS
jgi:imidazolonepropionase-like amidohydrolase